MRSLQSWYTLIYDIQCIYKINACIILCIGGGYIHVVLGGIMYSYIVSAPDLFLKKERGNDVRGNGLGLGLGVSSIKEINAQVQYMTVQYVHCTYTL